jgi:hypothetical protein
MAQKRRTRIGKLSTVSMVGSEIARLYKQSRRGEIDSLVAYRLATVLGMLAKCLETGAVEAQLAELREAIDKQEPHNVVQLRPRSA